MSKQPRHSRLPSHIPVIASGGVSSLDDIKRLKASGTPIAGVIIGRALYDGQIDPALALAAAGMSQV